MLYSYRMANMKDDERINSPLSDELEKLRLRVEELELNKAEHEKVDEALRESEEKYRSLVENVNFGIYRNTGGPHGRFLQANPAIARMFGYDSVEEFMKVPVSSLYQDPEERKHFIDEASQNGFLRDKAIRLKKKDGTHIVGSCTSKIQYNNDGSIKWIDGVIEDITDRKQAEESIEKSRYFEQTISSVLKVALKPISLDEQLDVILDLILAIPFISPEAKGLIYLVEDEPDVLIMKAQRGFDSEELSECSRLPFGRELCGLAATTCKIVFSGEVTGNSEMFAAGLPHGQYCVPIISGERVYGVFSLVLKEGHARDEPEEKFLLSIADTLAGIIEHRRTEIEKEKLQGRLIQSEKLSALGRITANVAHEIRNPVTVLGGLAKRLGRSVSWGEKEKEYTDIIVSEAGRLEKILRSVLSFTRQEHIQKENHNIVEIINESLRVMQLMYKEKSISFQTNFDNPAAQVPVDKDQVREVIDNLISNSAEAMHGGGKITITTGMGLIDGNSNFTLQVTDTGKGMSDEELHNIFEPFFTTKAVGSGDGIGLGLAICRKIMDEHKGTIKVESDTLKGTTFTLFFPLNK